MSPFIAGLAPPSFPSFGGSPPLFCNYIISFAIFENSNSHAILGLDTEGMDKHSYIINDEECAIYSTPDLQRSTFALQRDDIAIAIFGDLSPNDIINIVKNIHGLN